MSIAVVVPTIRPESIPAFKEAWKHLFYGHDVHFVLVLDGKMPIVQYRQDKFKAKEFMPKELITNFSAAVRNVGFAFVARYLADVEYIVTLDDDETPIGDPIQAHVEQLGRKVPISWMSTAVEEYMRGFPYEVRTEAPVMLSHGVWRGVYDWDAPSQLLKGNKAVEFYKGPIPKGALFPMCGMNLAFRRELLPYMYFAPVGNFKGAERFDDIFAGIEIKKDLDRLGWAVVTGYAECQHDRASNVFTSLQREAVGIGKNEEYWQGKHDSWYRDFLKKRQIWHKYISNG